MYVLVPFLCFVSVALASSTFLVDLEYPPGTQFEVVEDVWLAPFKFLRASYSPKFHQVMASFVQSVDSESLRAQVESLVSDLNDAVNDLRKDVVTIVLDANQVPSQLKFDILEDSVQELRHVVYCSLFEKNENVFREFMERMHKFIHPTVSAFRVSESGEEKLYAKFSVPRSLDDVASLSETLNQNSNQTQKEVI